MSVLRQTGDCAARIAASGTAAPGCAWVRQDARRPLLPTPVTLERWWITPILALVALVIAACGGNDDDAVPTATPVEATASVRSSPTPAVTATVSPPAPPPVAPTPLPAGIAPIPTRAPPAPGSVTITAVGDVSLARGLVPRMAENGAYYPYALIQPVLDGDIVIGNLEGALTNNGEPWPKGYNFRTPPEYASGLAQAGFDLVSLANNHAMDYGAIGLTDTMAALDAVGVAHGGAGANLDAAISADVVSANGLRVAFVSCALTPDEYGGFSITAWAAGAGTGMFVCNEADLARAIAAARAQADFAIVVVHAGSEYIDAPNSTQRQVAAWAFAAGADAYIGHHAHVVQPVELSGGKLTAWGLGNFIFDLDEVDLANIPEPRVSLALRFTLTQGAGVTSFEALPVVLDDTQDRPRLATVEEAAVLFELIAP